MLNRVASLADISLKLHGMKFTQEFLEEMNPWDDPVIDMCQIIRLMAQREWNARKGRFLKGYWNRLPVQDQLLAEAEAEYLSDLAWSMRYYELIRKRDKYLATDLEKFDKEFETLPSFINKIKVQAAETASYIQQRLDSGDELNYTNHDHMTRLVQVSASMALFPPNHPVHGIEQQLEHIQLDAFSAEHTYMRETALGREADWLRTWRERIAPKQEQLRVGFMIMMGYFTDMLPRNELEGATAQKHLLLTNAQIPKPTFGSFDGWWQYCGIHARRLNATEAKSLSNWAGFVPEWIMTYVPPLMPKSKEHLAGGAPDQSSDSQHSLTARSKGHTRDEEKRIQYGHWVARTVLLDRNGNTSLVAAEHFDSMNDQKMGFAERAIGTIPNVQSPSQLIAKGRISDFYLLDGLNQEEASMLWSYVADPELEVEMEESFIPRFKRGTVGDPWFSLSKFYGVHLRFDFDNWGTIALRDWCAAFERAAMEAFMQPNLASRLGYLIHDVAVLQHRVRKPAHEVAVKKGHTNLRFDMSMLE